MNELLLTFLISFVVAGVSANPILKGLIALNSRQTVSQYVAEHAHKQGTPTMGGIIILVGAFAGLVYWSMTGFGSSAAAVLTIVVGYALIGFFDDFVLPRVKKGSRGLKWIPKLALQVGFAAASVWLYQSGTGPISAMKFGAGVFLVLFFANAFNFSDGLDWLSGSILLALGAGVTACALVMGHGWWVFPMVAILGALLPFMELNRPPAKVFMGDVGSMPIGGVIGLVFTDLALELAPMASNTWLAIAGLAVVSTVMAIELVPVPLQILSVKLRKERLFPMTPIHHAFQKAGWPEVKIVAMFFAIQAVSSVVGFLLVSRAVQ